MEVFDSDDIPQEDREILIDAPTGEMVRFNCYPVDQATLDAMEEIFSSFEFY